MEMQKVSSKFRESISQGGLFLSKKTCFAMIAVDILIGIATLIVKIEQHQPNLQYAQLLATYQFGIMRRALVGEIWALLTGGGPVPVHDVFVLGGSVIAITIVLFILAFRSIFRFSEDSLPVFVYTFGSPFWFKNFVFSIGYFDIYGCLVALLALILAVNAFYMPIVGVLCVLLLLVHHIHFFLYLPAIAAIVLVRHRVARKWDLQFAIWVVAISLICVAALLYLALIVRPPVSPEQFLEALQSRATGPFDRSVVIWYSTIPEEIGKVMFLLSHNLERVPIYGVLFLLHAPLFAYFSRLLRELADRTDRLIIVASVVGITLSYLVIFIVAYDYSRWVSNWAVCMMLLMFALKTLPSRASPMPPIARTPRNAVLAWCVTICPRVGVTYPF
jgi:hypothetical protein